MCDKIEKAMKVLKDAMQDNELGSYAHSWHSTIAMCVYDESTKDVSHEEAHRIGNAAASRFMKLCFDVDTKN